MKKKNITITLIAVLILAIAAGLIVWAHKASVAKKNLDAVSQTDPNLKSFYGFDAGYSFAYPRAFDATGPDDAGTATLIIPAAFMPKTNFGGATLTVSSSAVGDSEAIAACNDVAPADGEQAPTVLPGVTINGVAYSKSTSTGAAAGTRYTTVTYHAVHGSRCYTVTYVIRAANLGNFDKGQGVSAYNADQISNILEGIVGTLKLS